MVDPRDPYNEFPDRRSPYRQRMDLSEGGGIWGWVAGGVVVALLILAFAFGGNNERTASTPTASPPATTGQAPPAAPSENTGQAPSTPRPATPAQ